MLTVSLLLFTVSFVVDFALAAPTSKSLWTITIFRGPAPSPEDGPPASANALRDPTKRKFEIIGIVAAYLVWIVVTGVALLIVGRRLRGRQESSDQSLRMEIIKPAGQVTLHEIDTGARGPLSPKSPGKFSSLKSWAKGPKNRASDASLSTVNTRIDDKVIESDRAKNMDDMTKLYAAVMAHDEERASTRVQSTESSPITGGNTPITPKSPRSPQYPPQMAHPAYMPHMSQIYQEAPYEPMPPPPIPQESDEQSLLENQMTPRKTKNSALSIISNTTSRLGSSHSNKARPSPITVRGQPISRPLGSADLRQSAFSPSQSSFQSNLYSPGPPPPTPGRNQTQTPATVTEEIEMQGRPRLVSFTSDDSANSSSKALPFRQFYTEALRSAPATKTTFVDRRQSVLNGGPKTGVPKTPYSPYCPSTPMTPITPRKLLGKEELKKNKKQYALKVVRENDMVQSDNDMWGTD